MGILEDVHSQYKYYNDAETTYEEAIRDFHSQLNSSQRQELLVILQGYLKDRLMDDFVERWSDRALFNLSLLDLVEKEIKNI